MDTYNASEIRKRDDGYKSMAPNHNICKPKVTKHEQVIYNLKNKNNRSRQRMMLNKFTYKTRQETLQSWGMICQTMGSANRDYK